MEEVQEQEPSTVDEALKIATLEQLTEELEMRAEPSKDAQKAAKEYRDNDLSPVYLSVGGTEFLYRSVGRKEWRNLVKKQNTAIAEAGENLVQIAEAKEDAKERLVETALLWSSATKKIDNLGAGTVEILADVILLESGFGPPDNEPMKI